MELKLDCYDVVVEVVKDFNRTIVELKPLLPTAMAISALYFNRTIVELKLAQALVNIYQKKILIEP